MDWSIEELEILARNNNKVVAELTGRSVEEVAGRYRLCQRNCADAR
nr:MAG TPA_asm: DnaJ-like protein [Caudoviricetes sp.]